MVERRNGKLELVCQLLWLEHDLSEELKRWEAHPDNAI